MGNSNMSTVLDHCGEERAEPESKVFDIIDDTN